MLERPEIQRSELVHKFEQYLISRFKDCPFVRQFPQPMGELFLKYERVFSFLSDYLYLDPVIMSHIVDMINYVPVSSVDSESELRR